MAETKRFVVFHDYGPGEGWKIVGDAPTVYQAVMARERDVRNGGGTTLICEVVPLLEAYRRADYERDKLTERDPIDA